MQNRSTEGCSKLIRSVDMTSSGKNGLNIRTNASPKWDRTRCPEEYTHCFQNEFILRHACMQKYSVLKINADDGSKFVEKLILV